MLKRFEDRKECTKCHIIKLYENFYISRSKLDGHTYHCKECADRITKERYERDNVKILERSRAHYEENKERILKRQSKYVKDGRKKKKYNPQKEASRALLRYAVRMGRIQRQYCEVCGTGKTDAHHEDYTKPLDVRWLCRKHHMKLHRKFPLIK